MKFRPFDPNAEMSTFRRNLPHWRQEGSTYFVTWRLADSLPAEQLAAWSEERDIWLRARGLDSPAEISKLYPAERAQYHNYFGEKLEAWLDAGFGECVLARPQISAIVEEALRFFDGERYALGEFVIMPNHVHAIVTPAADIELSDVLHTWKSVTANSSNQVLGRTGRFWQHESFDHIIRSEGQLDYLKGYISSNPRGLRKGTFRIGNGRLIPQGDQKAEDAAKDAQAGINESPALTQQSKLAACTTLQAGSLRHITLRHFRCFDQFEAKFVPGMNFIIGPNARGKSSLLEAACILLRLQSPRVTQLARVVQHGKRGLVVDGWFDQRHMQFYYSTQRKKLALDGVEQSNAREWLGIARAMWFGNEDVEIVRGAAEKRRRFLDFVAFQRDAAHRPALRSFEHALRSRNHLLRQPSPRWREVAAFDAPLVEHGARVAATRRALLVEMQADAEAAQLAISGRRESLQLEYAPGAQDDFATALTAARAEDTRLRQTTVGPHRDDVHFTLNGHPASEASEGQQRTLVLALKLGAARSLARHFETPPVLLLDDTFGELDPERRNALLAALPDDAQKIITTTHLDWMPDASNAHIIRLK